MQHQPHKPNSSLRIVTPIPENASPFSEQSLKDAFQIWSDPKNWNLGLRLLSINFDLNQVLFTWALDTTFHSSFILIYTCKEQFYNDELDQTIIQHVLEDAFNDSEISGDADWDYTFNGISLIVTLRHSYPL